MTNEFSGNQLATVARHFALPCLWDSQSIELVKSFGGECPRCVTRLPSLFSNIREGAMVEGRGLQDTAMCKMERLLIHLKVSFWTSQDSLSKSANVAGVIKSPVEAGEGHKGVL